MKTLSKVLVGLTAVLVLGIRAMAQEDLLTNTNYATAPGWHIVYDPFVAPTEATLTVTNGQAISLVNERVVLTASGQASGYTNTITITQPYRKAGTFYIRIDPASSNVVKIADAASVVLGSDIVLGDNATVVLDVIATNKAVLLSSTATVPVSAGTMASAIADAVAAGTSSTNLIYVSTAGSVALTTTNAIMGNGTTNTVITGVTYTAGTIKTNAVAVEVE